MYLLLDANVVAAYYLPRCTSSARSRSRIENIINSVRSGSTDHFLYMPNFCIAETFSVFMKHAFGKWNTHVQRAGGKIDARVYRSLTKQFGADIHNGKFIYQYELARYHILGIDLVAPVDHHYQITRGKKYHAPMGTFDHLIISMGVHLAHIHGHDSVAIISSDSRLTNILAKCKSGLKARTIEKLKLNAAEDVTGRKFGPTLFPRFLNLKTATNSDLAGVFGSWPLPVGTLPKVYRWLAV